MIIQASKDSGDTTETLDKVLSEARKGLFYMKTVSKQIRGEAANLDLVKVHETNLIYDVLGLGTDLAKKKAVDS